jgi:hypothetical protein
MDSLFISLTTSLLLALSATVFVCQAPGEAPLFSDLPCPHGTTLQIEPAPLIQSVGPVSIGAEADNPSRVTTSRASTGRSQGRQVTVSRVELCEKARTGLREVQMKKRKGYSLAEAAQLESDLQEHRGTIRASCW